MDAEKPVKESKEGVQGTTQLVAGCLMEDTRSLSIVCTTPRPQQARPSQEEKAQSGREFPSLAKEVNPDLQTSPTMCNVHLKV